MNETTLTRERILEAAQDTLRRFGPAKATVVDVARALGVSHGSVYKHFASKAELREAVTKIWLAGVHEPLNAIVSEDAAATERLHRWLQTLIATKRSRAFDDPELFATYIQLAGESQAVVHEHMDDLTRQVAQIIQEGMTAQEFGADDPLAMARAVLVATARFHHPAHAWEWSDPTIDAAFDEVWRLILNGLKAKS